MKRSILVLLFLTATTAVAACGGAQPQNTTGTGGQNNAASAPKPGGSPPPEVRAYRNCLNQNGVTPPAAGRPSGAPKAPPSGAPRGVAPNPDQPPPGVDAATWQKAMTACASLRPSPRAQR